MFPANAGLNGIAGRTQIIRMSVCSAAIEKFIGRCRSRPLWVAGWLILVGAVAFAAETLRSLPGNNALVEKDQEVAVRYAQMHAKFELVDKTIEMMMEAAVEAIRSFDESIGRNLRSDPKVVESTLVTIAEARGAIDSMKAVFGSLYFGDQDADQVLTGFRQDIEAVDDALRARSEVLKKLSADDQDGAALQWKPLLNSEAPHNRRLETFGLRVHAFTQLTQRKRLEHAVDLDSRKMRRFNYQIRLYTLGPICAYVGFFSMFAWHARRRAASSSGRNGVEA